MRGSKKKRGDRGRKREKEGDRKQEKVRDKERQSETRKARGRVKNPEWGMKKRVTEKRERKKRERGRDGEKEKASEREREFSVFIMNPEHTDLYVSFTSSHRPCVKSLLIFSSDVDLLQRRERK